MLGLWMDPKLTPMQWKVCYFLVGLTLNGPKTLSGMAVRQVRRVFGSGFTVVYVGS